MSAALLDVNVLVALFDPAHPNHEDAHEWFGSAKKRPWATCPLTLNGCVRVLSSAAYPSFSTTPAEVIASLRTLCDHPHHEFWADEVSILDSTLFRAAQIHNSRMITDAYLLGTAVRRGGCLVTFDRSIPIKAVVGAEPRSILVLG